ncbi:MAG: hypothetical protein OEY28_05210, partial [Nitrospira sp.]|nr:hypothetical protein [Nitrospira sp.]
MRTRTFSAPLWDFPQSHDDHTLVTILEGHHEHGGNRLRSGKTIYQMTGNPSGGSMKIVCAWCE